MNNTKEQKQRALTSINPPIEKINYAIDDCYMELKKFYPEIDLEDKYILIIQNQLNFPYINFGMDINIKLNGVPLLCNGFLNNLRSMVMDNPLYLEKFKKSYPSIVENSSSIDEFIDNVMYSNDVYIENIDDLLQDNAISLREPYQGEKVISTNLSKDGRIFKYGIPIIFDSFEDMKKLTDVDIIMKIIVNSDSAMELTLNFTNKLTYNSNKSNNKNLYVLNSNNLIFSANEYKLFAKHVIEDDRISSYIDSFDIIAHVTNTNNSIDIEYIIGDEKENFKEINGSVEYTGSLIDTGLALNNELFSFKKNNILNACDISYDFTEAE